MATALRDAVEINDNASERPGRPSGTGAPRSGGWVWRVELSNSQWQRRHGFIVALLWLHAVGLAGYAYLTGQTLAHSLTEGMIIAAVALAVGFGGHHFRRLRSMVASFGLITASAILVHLSGGLIEAHFHFFVMLAVVALYKDWLPYGVALVYVVGHHGVLGTITPEEVYNHGAAWRNPWLWALVHGGFVLGATVAHVLNLQGEKG